MGQSKIRASASGACVKASVGVASATRDTAACVAAVCIEDRSPSKQGMPTSRGSVKRPEDEYYSTEEEEEEEYSEPSSEPSEPPGVPEVVNGRFQVKEEIGSGSYSEVYLGLDQESGDRVAIKVEWHYAEKGDKLLAEAKLYRDLNGSKNNVPRIYWSGTQSQYNIMVMELLGPSLDDLQKKYTSFSLRTVLMLAPQMISRIEYVHSCGILYRDIKPHNFLMGLGGLSRHVYVVDFGLAKRYLDSKGEHIPCNRKKGRGVTGTVRYSSLNVHKGYDAGRRDDLEALGYVLVHFLKGGLPWLGLKAKSKRTKHELIFKKKKSTSDEELCDGLPHEFVEYFQYCRSLKYADRPDYEYLCNTFRRLFERKGFKSDAEYDWARDAAGKRSRRSASRGRNKVKSGSAERPEPRRRRSRSTRRR
mmetsp:Transcript_59946/g.104880  ORF Transcript_59946/g.104880 Transcript_59946/m.104880 type:complete len:418 (-) Transcript_59946:190-1443(-)